jgi:hypothetical protein
MDPPPPVAEQKPPDRKPAEISKPVRNQSQSLPLAEASTPSHVEGPELVPHGPPKSEKPAHAAAPQASNREAPEQKFVHQPVMPAAAQTAEFHGPDKPPSSPASQPGQAPPSLEIMPEIVTPKPSSVLSAFRFRLGEDRASPVDVSLSGSGNEIRLTVRTPDPQLNQRLRDDLQELVAGIERSGFQATAVVRPSATHTAGDSSPTGQAHWSGNSADESRRQRQQREQDPRHANEQRPKESDASASFQSFFHQPASD